MVIPMLNAWLLLITVVVVTSYNALPSPKQPLKFSYTAMRATGGITLLDVTHAAMPHQRVLC
ncbi:hypothetical protein AA106555_1517 [Neokomagataea thailandica NBRC 106555]|uniref:Secreted protein n=1 Tax=Neokomagataea thailandica NBRC 106555 TaxID=1223520 RepID=A0ABQ0QR91_9PROT|nr:hypothetical protein AA106555_1517 [Neokomagataea thailandica NBRC 106555]